MRIAYGQPDHNGLAEFLSGYPENIAYETLPDDLITITGAEFNDILNNRDTRRYDTANKKIVEYTPPELTAEEKQAQALVALDAEYQPQFSDLAQALGVATLDGNQENINGIKADYAALKTEYQQKREAITNG